MLKYTILVETPLFISLIECIFIWWAYIAKQDTWLYCMNMLLLFYYHWPWLSKSSGCNPSFRWFGIKLISTTLHHICGSRGGTVGPAPPLSNRSPHFPWAVPPSFSWPKGGGGRWGSIRQKCATPVFSTTPLLFQILDPPSLSLPPTLYINTMY